jgi:predicted TIM-barrel fold metal-dependent hydrolase
MGARRLAREANEYCARLRDAQPQRYGFFAALPNALDTQGTLAEIAYALDVLKADGVTLFTRYGNGNYYLGHSDLAPIWKELNTRSAVVFIHPTHPVDTSTVSPVLLQPTLDYPHETTRTVYDMILSNTKRNNPNCKVILPHAGGNLPWIYPRSMTLLRGLPQDRLPAYNKTYEEVWEDFRSFYFDVALSQSHEGLDLLRSRVPDDHILYGK